MLSNDIARCAGSGSEEEGWREGCEDCQRRTADRPAYAYWMITPPIIVFECEFRIEP